MDNRAKTRQQKWLYKLKCAICGIASGVLYIVSANAHATPVADHVAAGTISIQQSHESTVIQQSTQKGVINWRSFNINANESVHFQQPVGGVTLNRINPTAGASAIYGRLTATGQIFLINPAGIYFGPSAYVNVGGLVATTHNIADADFMNGHYSFANVHPYSGAIINDGTIIAQQHGLVVLVGANVTNNGLIAANLGKVILASGEAFTMSFDDGGMINFAITNATSKRGVDQHDNELSDGVVNNGKIYANGGTILVTAKAAANLLDHMINMNGLIEARSVEKAGGTIILSADGAATKSSIRVAGKLDASGKESQQTGGQIKILGERLLIDADAYIDASGSVGGGQVLIGGNAHGIGPEFNATHTYFSNGAIVNADAIMSGDGGKVVVWSDLDTHFYGAITARGGSLSGNGGWVETSGKRYLDANGGYVNLLAPQGTTGTWLLDPTNIWIASSQANATAAGMVGTDASASTDAGGDPNTFSAGGAVNDSFLLTTNLTNALSTANVIVTTTNASGAGAGNITVVNPIAWSSANSLTLNAEGTIAINAGITTGAVGSALILNAVGNVTQTAAIGGSGGLTKQGAGTATLSQSNTYSGATNVTGGILRLTSISALNNTSSITVASGAELNMAITTSGSTLTNTSNITINGAGIGGTSSALKFLNNNILNNNIILGSDSTIGASVNDGRLNGVISGAYNLTFALGGRTISLAGSNTYSGTTTLTQSGSVTLLNANALNNTTAISLTSNTLRFGFNGTLGNNGNATITSNAGSLSFSDNATIDNNIVLNGLTTINSSAAGVLNGVISGSNILNVASGTVSLFGNNTYSGGTRIGTGTVIINTLTNFGLSSSAGTGSFTFTSNSGTLQYVGTGHSSNRNFALVGSNFTNNIDASGSGTLTLSGSIFNNAFLALTGTGNGIVSGNISTSGIIKNGTGKWTITDDLNNISGAVTINSGTLAATSLANAGTTSALGRGSTITIGATGVLQYIGSVNRTSNRPIALSASGGTIDIAGNGTLTLTGGITGTNTALNLKGTGIGTVSTTAIAVGSGTVTKSDSGTWILSATNTYTGATNINGGVLRISADTNLGTAPVSATAGKLSFDGGTLETTTDLTLNSNRGIALNAGGGTIQVTSGTLQYGGIIAGTTALTKTGAGTLSLSGASTYSGGTILSNGILSISSSSTGAITNGPLGTGALTLTSGTLLSSGSFSIANAYTVNGNITLGDANNFDLTLAGLGTFTSGTLNVVSAGTTTLSGNLSGSAALTENANGKLIISGADNSGYSGAITLTTGTLEVGAASNALGTHALTLNGGNLQSNLAATLANQYTVSGNVSMNGANNLTLTNTGTLSSGTLTVTNTGTTTLSGNLSGSAALIENTSGKLIISGADNSGYSGAITLTAGTLEIGVASNALGTNTLTLNGGNLQSSLTTSLNNQYTVNGDVGITGTNHLTLASTGTLSSGTLTVTNTGTTTLSGNLSGSAALIENTSGKLIISGADNSGYSGAITLTAGTLEIGANTNALGTNTLTLSGGHLQSNLTATLANQYTVNGNADITGTNSLILAGAGTLSSGTLTVTNTGTTTLSGNLSGSAALTENTSGKLVISGADNSQYSGEITLNAGTLEVDVAANALGTNALTLNAGNLQSNRAASLGNQYIINGNVGITGTNNLTLTGTGTLSSGTLTVTNTGTTTLSGNLSGSAALTENTSGKLVISGADNSQYSGEITLNAGTLEVDVAANALGTNALTLNAGNLQSNRAASLGNQYIINGNVGITGTNNLTLTGTGTLSSGILTVTNTGTTTLSGNLSGSAALTENTSGKLIISGTNNGGYSGAITLTAGTLEVGAASNALGTNTLTLNGGNLQSDFTTSLSNQYIINGNVGITGTNNLTLTGTGTLSSGTLTVTNTGTTTLSGNLSGSAALIENTSGKLIISGADNNGYSGAITLAAGTLEVGVATNAFGTNTLTLNGGNLQSNLPATLANQYTVNGNASISGANNLTLTNTGTLSSGTLTVTNTGTTTLSGNLSGNAALIENTSGILNISGTNSGYSGAVTLTNGTLEVGAATNQLGSNQLILYGGSLRASASTILDNEFIIYGSTQITGNHNIELAGNGTLHDTLVNSNNAITTLSGNLDGASGLIQSAGTLTLSGNNTFNGAVVINAGTVNANSATSLGSTSGTTTINANGTLHLNNIALNGESIVLNNGVLSSSGNSTLTGPLTLMSATSNELTSSGILTINNNINGNGALTLRGAGAYILNGNIGDQVALTNLTVDTPLTISGSITTSQNQIYNAPITLNSDASFVSTLGVITLNDMVNGGFNLSITSAGSTTFAKDVGSINPLTSLTVNANNIYISHLSNPTTTIKTVDSQIYNGQLVLDVNASLINTGANSTTLAINAGATGNYDITMSSPNATNSQFTLSGLLAVKNIAVNGNMASNNTLTVTAGTTQNWFIFLANGGLLSNLPGLTGAFTFDHIQNLSGGIDNYYLLNGGTITGHIVGGSGHNSLQGDNVFNTWMISGLNAGSVTGVQAFSNMQTLIGGNAGNNFIFADGAAISGSITGSLTTPTSYKNTIDTQQYLNPVTVNLNADTMSGNIQNIFKNVIAFFSNINNLIGNATTDNRINFPSSVQHVAYTGNREGYVNQTFFNGFTLNATLTPDLPPVEFVPQAVVARVLAVAFSNNTQVVNDLRFNDIDINDDAFVLYDDKNFISPSILDNTFSSNNVYQITDGNFFLNLKTERR